MIVTCPSCSSSYKVNESKIKGRGAKITCPRCRQRFVVYRDQQGASIPPDIVSHDFRTLGIVWRVRKGMGVTYSFHDLAGLKEAIHDGQVNHWDSITYDNRNWEPIKDHDPLDAYFWDIWQKAQRGEITIHPPEDEEEDDEEEDESDAPTTIVGRGSQLASQISQAVTDAATPAPMDSRESDYEGAGHLVLDDEDDEDQRTVMHADAMDEDDDHAEPEMVGATPEPAPEYEAAPPAMMDEGDVDDDELEEDGPAPLIAPENMATDTSAPPRPERPPLPKPPTRPAPAESESGGGLSFGLIAAGVLMLIVLAAAGIWGTGIFGSTNSVEKPAPTPSPAVQPAKPDPKPEPQPEPEGTDEEPNGTAEEPAPEPAPAAQPEPAPAPEPAPTAQPEPAAQPDPAPTAQPDPAPAAQPDPAPAAQPDPAPAAQPDPAPEAPDPEPPPAPEPEAPAPDPAPTEPAPEAPAPAPPAPSDAEGTPSDGG